MMDNNINTNTIELSNFCICWEIALKNGMQLYFTSHNEDIQINQTRYQKVSEQTPGLIASYADWDVNLVAGAVEITFNFTNPNINEEDVRLGVYDNARVDILLVEIGKVQAAPMTLYHGFIGGIKIGNGYFTAQLLDNSVMFEKHFVSYYSAQCRAQFCDDRCGLKADKYTVSGKIAERIDAKTLVLDTINIVDGRYNGGLLTITSGKAAGQRLSIHSAYSNKISLTLACECGIIAGDGYELTAGCDKSIATCADVYNNAINFRGEPHLPGLVRNMTY